MAVRKKPEERQMDFEIRREKDRLLNLFKEIDENKLKFVETLIDRLAFLNVSIKYLEESISIEGTRVEYDNGGGQTGTKDNPDVKTHIAYTKNIATITKQLVDLVPQSAKKSKFEEFLNG